MLHISFFSVAVVHRVANSYRFMYIINMCPIANVRLFDLSQPSISGLLHANASRDTTQYPGTKEAQTLDFSEYVLSYLIPILDLPSEPSVLIFACLTGMNGFTASWAR